ncbi:glycine betaine ABC transporter substrate-binding protein [Brucella sp. NF 2653]|uniref:glycine betaine ABC transporter substrate-binding protein n=1 Tax=Brucella sp. NF 2653 TaxID=693748 RepID=UPI003D151E8E
MNKRFKIAYLTGGDDFFGPNLGGAKVETNVRTGYTQECPNVGKFLTNLEFNLDMENDIMGKILDDGEEPAKAATEWLKANPGVLNNGLQALPPLTARKAACRQIGPRPLILNINRVAGKPRP